MKAANDHRHDVYRDLDVEDLLLEAATQLVQAAALMASRNREALLDLLPRHDTGASA